MTWEWLTVLEAMELARALRRSVWAYPLVNTAHILGVTLLIGAIVPLDLRLLGMWPSTPLAPLWRVLTRTAGAGLVLAILFGTLLFITRATEYATSNLFLTKMMVVGAGTANALVLHVLLPKDVLPLLSSTGKKPPRRARLAGGVSLVAWLAALTLGRLVGYF
jgi:hypothetical protein